MGVRLKAGSSYTARELTPARWADFEKLFAKHGGVQAGCWCMFYHRPRPVAGARRASRNRQDKRALVRRGRSHGILVYAEGQAVGWCQFGPRDELPRIDAGRNYRELALPGAVKLWRITCFFVDRDHRRRGVAQIALRAALQAIRKRGGGLVEAYPATNPRAVATWFGSVAMFERERFRQEAVLGKSNVVMRRRVT